MSYFILKFFIQYLINSIVLFTSALCNNLLLCVSTVIALIKSFFPVCLLVNPSEMQTKTSSSLVENSLGKNQFFSFKK